MSWCRASSQRTVSTTALRQMSWKCTLISSWQLTVDLFLPCACSTWLLDLTPSTMTYFFSVWSGSSVYVVSHCCGSGITWAADLTVFGSPALPRGSCTSAQFLRAQSSADLGPWLFIMYSADLADRAVEHDVNFHGYAYIRNYWNATSRTWTIGCLRTGSN